MQRLLVASYRRFGPASRSHLHVSTVGLVNMRPTGCPETSVTRNQRCLTPQNCEYLFCTFCIFQDFLSVRHYSLFSHSRCYVGLVNVRVSFYCVAVPWFSSVSERYIILSFYDIVFPCFFILGVMHFSFSYLSVPWYFGGRCVAASAILLFAVGITQFCHSIAALCLQSV
jgi:hypothetical protein